MFERVIVPIDGSDFSWRALQPARALATQCDAVLELFQVVVLPDDIGLAEQFINDHLDKVGLGDAGVNVKVVVMGESIASTISAHVERSSGSIVVMSSVGRGRSAALIGSIAEELLAELFGPVMLVGPDANIDVTDFRGELLVPVDGSETSESALALAAAWGITLGARPWVVSVIESGSQVEADTSESSYPSRLARGLAKQTGRDIEFEVLHGGKPERAICDFASSLPATLIVASTHGRTGFARIAAGSVAMGIVRHAPCPVVLNRPPHLN
ncbi:MAG: universal stress protein [Ilumatobacter sp.]|nr:MAG: universal stress protein [Ilumatobacter sp.]